MGKWMGALLGLLLLAILQAIAPTGDPEPPKEVARLLEMRSWNAQQFRRQLWAGHALDRNKRPQLHNAGRGVDWYDSALALRACFVGKRVTWLSQSIKEVPGDSTSPILMSLRACYGKEDTLVPSHAGWDTFEYIFLEQGVMATVHVVKRQCLKVAVFPPCTMAEYLALHYDDPGHLLDLPRR